MVTQTLHLSGMHCVSCSMLIEGELEDVGVTAKANYAKQTVEVTFDEKKTDLSTIQKTIGKIGYRVTGIVS